MQKVIFYSNQKRAINKQKNLLMYKDYNEQIFYLSTITTINEPASQKLCGTLELFWQYVLLYEQ